MHLLFGARRQFNGHLVAKQYDPFIVIVQELPLLYGARRQFFADNLLGFFGLQKTFHTQVSLNFTFSSFYILFSFSFLFLFLFSCSRSLVLVPLFSFPCSRSLVLVLLFLFSRSRSPPPSSPSPPSPGFLHIWRYERVCAHQTEARLILQTKLFSTV